jgi:hypothetical protein
MELVFKYQPLQPMLGAWENFGESKNVSMPITKP